MKISRIGEFCVVMGIMAELLGCCSSSTLGCRENDYVKALATLGFWLHHSPCSLDKQLPRSPGHYRLNHTLYQVFLLRLCHATINTLSHQNPFAATVNFVYATTNSLQWRHNESDGGSNHWRLDCLLNRVFRRRSKKISKYRATGHCEGNSPVTGEFPAHGTSNASNISI